MLTLRHFKSLPDVRSSRYIIHATRNLIRAEEGREYRENSIFYRDGGKNFFERPGIAGARGLSGHDQTGPDGIFGEVHRAVKTQLAHQIAPVNFYRARRDMQFGSNFRSALALSNQGGDLQFAPR